MSDLDLERAFPGGFNDDDDLDQPVHVRYDTSELRLGKGSRFAFVNRLKGYFTSTELSTTSRLAHEGPMIRVVRPENLAVMESVVIDASTESNQE